jgi:hypothetical protein
MLRIWGAVAILAVAGGAQAQGKFGTYEGVVKITGTEESKTSKLAYRADVKIAMPMTDASMAEIGDVDKPSAVATITQWDLDERNAGPDSDGKITSWKCKLAAPVTVPMNAQGVLNVDKSAKKHSMFVAVVGLKPIPLNCVNTRSGPYKTTKAAGFAFGTNEPGAVPYNELPFADASRLSAKYKLVPTSQGPGRKIAIDQEWDFALRK